MSRPRILTSGIASEYTLGPLSEYLRTEGWDVTELDFSSFSGDVHKILDAVEPHSTIYITSAHTNMTTRVAARVSPSTALGYPQALAPLEIMARIRPRCSMYVPHDLLEIFADPGLGEERFLDLYDFILAPYDLPGLRSQLAKSTQVVDAGWVKHDARARRDAATEVPDGDLRIVVFVSLFAHMLELLGIDGLCEYLRPLLGPSVRVKVPAWTGAQEFSRRLAETTDAIVVDPTASSTELILDADIVVCNGVSSIHAEAALLGRPCIVLVEDAPFGPGGQHRRLSHLPNLTFIDYADQRGPIPSSLLRDLANEPRAALVRPFDFSLVSNILTRFA